MQFYFGSGGGASTENDPEKIGRLRNKLAEFVRKCDFALRLNNKLIGEDQKEYQNAMSEHFHILKSEAINYRILEL